MNSSKISSHAHLNLKGIITLLIGIISISFAAPLFKLSQPIHPLIAAATRLSFASGLWLIITITQAYPSKSTAQSSASYPTPQKQDKINWSEQILVGSFCGFCYAIHFGAWVWSLGLTSVIASATLVTTTPIMLGLIAWLSGKDRPSSRLFFSGLIASIGITLFIFDPHSATESKWIGDFLALLGALAMVPYLLITRKKKAVIQIAPFSLVATLVGALILWILAILSIDQSEFILASGPQLYALLGTALVPQLIGHSALTISLRYFTPTEVGIATLLEPIGASLIAWFLIAETLNIRSVYAAIITLSGVLLALAEPRPKNRS
ncbi:MAG: hypothetical protein CL916_08335 [Deltaproteobacteria bacterium]|nr:hypothetical protein [Deltaproteobacteria bacterium]